MRRGLEAARDRGVNLAFMGANTCYRKIRLEASPLGDHRRQVNYRSTADPVMAVDPSEATVSWRDAPVSEPESSLIGNFYEANPVDADMVVADDAAWVFDGSGLRNGDRLPRLVGNEYDRVTPEVPTPGDIQVLFHSPVVCKGRRSFADATWYTAPSGAGVFSVGTFRWIPQLLFDVRGQRPSAANVPAAVQKVTENLFRAMASGPAGRDHPARNNLGRLGIGVGYVPDPPR